MAVPGQESGIVAWGEQRGAAFSDFDADGRTDIVIAQNAGQTLVFRNRGARPGLRVTLRYTPANPHGIGAAVQVLYTDGQGPIREISAGTGYGSADDPVTVLGLRDESPVAVRVRWPDGEVTRTPVPPGRRSVEIGRDGGSGP